MNERYIYLDTIKSIRDYFRSEEESKRERQREARDPRTNRANFRNGVRNMLDGHKARRYC